MKGSVKASQIRKIAIARPTNVGLIPRQMLRTIWQIRSMICIPGMRATVAAE